MPTRFHYWLGYAVARWVPLAWLHRPGPAWRAHDRADDDGLIVEVAATRRRVVVVRVPPRGSR